MDVIAALEAIMHQNTAYYQSDFAYDIKMLREAARSDQPEDKLLLWLTRDKHTEGKVSTFVDRVINNVWMVTGLTAWFVSMLTLFSQIRLPILFIILLTMGMGTTITGLIIRFRPATAGGAAAIVLAPVSLIVSGYWMPTLFAVGFVVMMIIPGHILNYKSNHTNG